MEVLNNQWWAYVAANYSITIMVIIGLIMTILKAIAVLHPSVTTNKIIDLFQQWVSSTPIGAVGQVQVGQKTGE
jgi:hypothetical protein